MNSSNFRAEARAKLAGKWGKVALITLAYMAIFFVLGFIEGLFEEGSTLQSIMSIIVAVIEVPLAFGMIIALFKVYNSEDVKAFDFLSLGFSNFKKSWGISFRMLLKLIVPVILLIVSIILISFGLVGAMSLLFSDSSASSGFSGAFVIGMILYVVSLIWILVKSYYYSLSYIVAADNETLTATEAVETSRQLMNGKRGKLFCLQFSFIGWAILASIPFIIGSLCGWSILKIFSFVIGYLWLVPYIQFATFAFYKYLKGDTSAVSKEEASQDAIEEK